MTNRAPLITAIVLLLLPVLYVGSYFALVDPVALREIRTGEPYFIVAHYRYGGQLASRLFWPLEQIDRKIRPGAWEVSEFL